MAHPLDLDKREERQEVLNDLFSFFWDKRSQALLKKLTDPTSTYRDDHAKHVVRSLSDNQEQLSGLFAEEIGSPLIPLISIRELEALVNQLFNRAVYELRTRESKDLIFIEENMDSWIVDIFRRLGNL